MIKSLVKWAVATLRAGVVLIKQSKQIVVIRAVAVLLMVALVTPVFLFNPTSQIQAQTRTTLPIQSSAPISLPPESFIVSGNSFSIDSITSVFGSFLSFSNKTISGLFDKPKVPAGLEQAENQLTPAASLTAENLNSENNTALPPLPAGSVRFDFDGDGKADLGRWKSSAAEWKVKNSSSGNFTTTTIGSSSSIITPGDFDGDGKTDAAVFSGGTWTIKKSSNGQTITVSFGTSGDKPVVGDYDGDGLADCAVFRPSTNTWWILQSSNANAISTAFGSSGDITAQGNFDGDSKTDLAVFRPSTGDWHVQGSSAGYFSFHWGVASDIPVPADFDGDGKTDFAIYRGSSGTWYVSKSSTNNTQYFTQVWGNYGDQPVAADYDGDGKDDLAIWRPTTGVWHLIKSSNSNYDYQTLGQTGDTAISSAYLKQIGGAVAGYDLAKARLLPKNSTGGTDLYSRNFSWETSLIGLSGRAGMGAGFGISYNSLVWTKELESNAIYFDADTSNISPGFRFGFPTIEPVYWNKDAKRFNYLMVTPSGARVEFRQIGASDTYETADSSYTQLKTNGAGNPNDPVEDISITLSGTNGSKMTYLWKAGAFRCAEIKDRNGNFITINHDEQGLLRTVTDTLGRVITVNYDAELYPTSITQTWKDNNGTDSNVTYTWASFTYSTTTVSTNFASGLNIVGPANETVLKVLQKITFPSGSYTTFEYNGYAQVKKVNNYAADEHLLNYVKTNLDNPSTAQTDCPRFTETRSWTENFNQNTSGVAQETIITNSLTENASYDLPGNISGTATKIEVSMANHPHGAVSKTFVGSSGWMESLPIVSEDWANGTGGSERKRWSWTNWTQDDTELDYIQNPRVTESKVGDATNIKRSTTEYRTYPLTTIAEYGLVSAVYVYDTDQTTILKKVETDYNLDSAYLSRRIIGLPGEVRAYGRENSALNLVSKVGYNYDEGDFNDTSLEQNISTVIQHDNTNFGASFVTGRGNPTSTTRYDVTGQTANVTSAVKYNTAGAVVAQIDALGRTVKISYADNFNDTTTSRHTYAYPTKITELANSDTTNNFSEVKYRFDSGANVWAKSPAPAGNTTGKETTRLYDAIGRLEKETLVNTGAYTRYEYPTNGIQSKNFATVIDMNNNGADATDEVYSESWTDGAGRVRKSRTEHPGSSGGYAGTLTEYDRLGQVTRSTVPTEIDASWNPAGDDNRGVDTNNQPIWLWNSQEYDWMGRTVREINTDGTDRLMSYDGCGCAGGLVATIKGEDIIETDWQGNNPVNLGRRTQKIYQDIQGRTWKSEVLNWDNTVYSSSTTAFDGLDRPLTSISFNGTADLSNEHQITTMTYDGHGRLKTKHNPEQSLNAVTSYNYNPDDSVLSVTDARGAISTRNYNSRGLLEQISYSVPQGSNIPVTPSTVFSYDAVGNRTQMTDQTGTTIYNYDSISQMASETKQFNGQNESPTESFTISYQYHLTGALKSITEPSGQRTDYANDKIGRLKEVTGTSFAGHPTVPSQLNNIKYRAWGAVKSMDYGSGATLNQTFDNRLRVSNYKVTGTNIYYPNPPYNTLTILEKEYNYYQDGRIRYVKDGNPALFPDGTQFDRFYKYDQVGRITSALSGDEARGQTPTNYRPYRQNFSYDVWGNVTSRQTWHWSKEINQTHAYQNNRETTWTYDADGRILSSNAANAYGTEYFQYVYDASGQVISTTKETPEDNGVGGINVIISNNWLWTDGDGRVVGQKVTSSLAGYPPTTKYLGFSIYSSVLGSVVREVGWDHKVLVYAFGSVLAYHELSDTPLKWVHRDPGNISYRTSYRGMMYGETTGGNAAELDPAGANAGTIDPYLQNNNLLVDGGFSWGYPGFGSPLPFSCRMDGADYSCSLVMRALVNGSAIPSSIAPLQRLPGFRFESHGNGMFTVSIGEFWLNPTTGRTFSPDQRQPEGTVWVSGESASASWINLAANAENLGGDEPVLPARFVRSEGVQKQWRDCVDPAINTYVSAVDALNLKSQNTYDDQTENYLGGSAAGGIGTANQSQRALRDILSGSKLPEYGGKFNWRFQKNYRGRGTLIFVISIGSIVYLRARARATEAEFKEFDQLTNTFVTAYSKCQDQFPADVPVFTNPRSRTGREIFRRLNGSPTSLLHDDGLWRYKNPYNLDSIIDSLIHEP